MSSVSPRRTVVGPAAQCRGVCCLRISSEGSPRTGIRCLLRARPRRVGVMTHRHPGPLEGPLLLMACPSPLASGRLEGRASRPRTQACLWRQPRWVPALVPTAGCWASRGNGPCRALFASAHQRMLPLAFMLRLEAVETHATHARERSFQIFLE